MSLVTVPAATYAALVDALRIQMEPNGHFYWCNQQTLQWGVECTGRCVVARQALADAHALCGEQAGGA